MGQDTQSLKGLGRIRVGSSGRQGVWAWVEVRAEAGFGELSV